MVLFPLIIYCLVLGVWGLHLTARPPSHNETWSINPYYMSIRKALCVNGQCLIWWFDGDPAPLARDNIIIDVIIDIKSKGVITRPYHIKATFKEAVHISPRWH